MGHGLLFPGQGAQFAGMGRDWVDSSAAAADLFARADDVLNVPLSSILLEGTEDEVTSTDIAQPGIFLVSASALAVLREEDRLEMPDVAAGLSLGEYTALHAAGSLSFEDALRLVRRRGELMQAASEKCASSMTSVMGLDREACEAACEESGGMVSVANLNAPGQVVISGEQDALDRAAEACAVAGARRVIPLAVAGAFHSEVMREAADGLAEVLVDVDIAQPAFPVISNVTGRPVSGPDEVRANLSEQVCSPVLWEDSMRTALSSGITSFIEFPPGQVLGGLMRKIDREVQVSAAALLDPAGGDQ